MDKLKQYGAALKKHHFWVLTGLIVIVGLVSWSMASKDLQARYNDNQGKLKQTFGGLDDLQRRADPSVGLERAPNEKFAEGLRTEQVTLRKQVFDAWKDVYAKQKLITIWPEQVKDINTLGPDERVPEDLRQNYMNAALPAEWKELFEAVRIRHPKAGQGGGNGFDQPMAHRNVEFEGIVVWDQEARDNLVKRFQVMEIPSDLRVRVTQENMWVFRSMIDLVVKLNEGANDSLAATVKRIDKLDLAQWAVADAQKNPGADLKVKKEGETEEAAPPSAMGAEEALVPLPDAPDHREDKWLLEGRYLDQKNQPISAEDAQKNPPFAEFKQMFVTMQFVMDQRRIPDLLAACANSPLRIEPRQVQMQFTDIDHQARNNNNEEGGGEWMNNGGGQFERGPYDCVLQIRGIVYIYNEPREQKLGTGSAPQPAQRELGIPVPKTAAPGLPVAEEQVF